VENGRWSVCSGVNGQFKLALGGQFDWRFQFNSILNLLQDFYKSLVAFSFLLSDFLTKYFALIKKNIFIIATLL
jgi:hypothetical protein